MYIYIIIYIKILKHWNVYKWKNSLFFVLNLVILKKNSWIDVFCSDKRLEIKKAFFTYIYIVTEFDKKNVILSPLKKNEKNEAFKL